MGFSLGRLVDRVSRSFVRRICFRSYGGVLGGCSGRGVHRGMFYGATSGRGPLGFACEATVVMAIISIFLYVPMCTTVDRLLASTLVSSDGQRLVKARAGSEDCVVLGSNMCAGRGKGIISVRRLTGSSSRFPRDEVIGDDLVPGFVPSSVMRVPASGSSRVCVVPRVVLVGGSLYMLARSGKGK